MGFSMQLDQNVTPDKKTSIHMCLLINGDCPAEQFTVDDQAN